MLNIFKKRGLDYYLKYNKYKFFQKNQIPLPIPKIARPNETRYWYFEDNEKNFKKNPHPKYLNGFTYKFNNYGYRCDDFDLENDKYKILTIGCSTSMGFGLPYEETYAYLLCDKLSKKYNISIKNYNLSQAGYGVDYICRMIFQTIDIIKPNYVIIYFPAFERMEFYDENETETYWNIIKTLYLDKIKENGKNYFFCNFVKHFNFIDEILKNRNINWFWTTWEETFIKCVLSDERFIHNLKKYIDVEKTDYTKSFILDAIRVAQENPNKDKTILARDWLHPGFEFNQFFANYLYDKIIEERVFENIQ
jgi:hypothetical protein